MKRAYYSDMADIPSNDELGFAAGRGTSRFSATHANRRERRNPSAIRPPFQEFSVKVEQPLDSAGL